MKSKVLIFLFSLSVMMGSTSVASNKDNKSSSAPAKATLSGVILDKASKEKLAGVSIQLISTNQKIYSDAKGEFSFDGIEPGEHKVKINCISYKEKEVTVKISKPQGEKVKIFLISVEP